MPVIEKRASAPVETDYQDDLRRALAQCDAIRIFRNNVGVLQDERGAYVRYGLSVGSSDLIGSVTIRTTPTPIAIPLAVEVKRPGKKPDPKQVHWLADKEAAGWIVVVASEPADVARAIGRYLARTKVKPTPDLQSFLDAFTLSA